MTMTEAKPTEKTEAKPTEKTEAELRHEEWQKLYDNVVEHPLFAAYLAKAEITLEEFADMKHTFRSLKEILKLCRDQQTYNQQRANKALEAKKKQAERDAVYKPVVEHPLFEVWLAKCRQTRQQFDAQKPPAFYLKLVLDWLRYAVDITGCKEAAAFMRHHRRFLSYTTPQMRRYYSQHIASVAADAPTRAARMGIAETPVGYTGRTHSDAGSKKRVRLTPEQKAARNAELADRTAKKPYVEVKHSEAVTGGVPQRGVAVAHAGLGQKERAAKGIKK